MDTFKIRFNKDFSLSYDGKFVGLDSLPNRALFEHKFVKIVERRSPHARPLDDVITFKLCGKVVKLYYR